MRTLSSTHHYPPAAFWQLIQGLPNLMMPGSIQHFTDAVQRCRNRFSTTKMDSYKMLKAIASKRANGDTIPTKIEDYVRDPEWKVGGSWSSFIDETLIMKIAQSSGKSLETPEELQHRAAALEDLNSFLKSFAHDLEEYLRSPLPNNEVPTFYLEERLNDFLTAFDLPDTVRQDLAEPSVSGWHDKESTDGLQKLLDSVETMHSRLSKVIELLKNPWNSTVTLSQIHRDARFLELIERIERSGPDWSDMADVVIAYTSECQTTTTREVVRRFMAQSDDYTMSCILPNEPEGEDKLVWFGGGLVFDLESDAVLKTPLTKSLKVIPVVETASSSSNAYLELASRIQDKKPIPLIGPVSDFTIQAAPEELRPKLIRVTNFCFLYETVVKIFETSLKRWAYELMEELSKTPDSDSPESEEEVSVELNHPLQNLCRNHARQAFIKHIASLEIPKSNDVLMSVDDAVKAFDWFWEQFPMKWNSDKEFIGRLTTAVQRELEAGEPTPSLTDVELISGRGLDQPLVGLWTL